MGKLYNLARMTTATTGTGNITLGAAVSGYLSFALAGAANGDVVSYAIKDGANSELGEATYSSTGPQLTGRTVTKSTNANAAISLSGSAEVYITARAEDLLTVLGGAIKSTSAAALTVGPNGATNPVLQVDASTASAATGWKLTGNAAASGFAVSVISSGANENLSIDAKGSGTLTLNGTATGNIIIPRAVTMSQGMTWASTSSAAIDATFNGASVNCLIGRSTTTGGSTMLLCVNPNGVVGSVSSSGSATAFNTASDQRLKIGFTPLERAGDIIDMLQVGSFRWKSDGAPGVGVLAQQANEVFPLAVTAGAADLSERDARPWSVDYSKFVPLLLAEVQALRARVAELEAK